MANVLPPLSLSSLRAGAPSQSLAPVCAIAAGDAVEAPYEVRYGDAVGTERRAFRTDLLGCCAAPSCSCACCCSWWLCGAFCGQCVWQDAMRLIGIDGALPAGLRVAAAVVDDQSRLGRAANAAASWLQGQKRAQLTRRLFGYDADECGSFCAHFCCSPCAAAQEVDAVIAYAHENRGIRLSYGCCSGRLHVDGVYPKQKLAPFFDAQGRARETV